MEILEEIKEQQPSESDYRITICQDGKFAVTFDTVTLWIKILENTDHRPFKFINDPDSPQTSSKSEIISDKAIAHFKINDFTIRKFNGKTDLSSNNEDAEDSEKTENEDKFKWSFDISNLRERKHSTDEYFIFVAISRINVDKDMKGTKNEDNESCATKRDYKKGYLAKEKLNTKTVTIDMQPNIPNNGTAIYCLNLEKSEEPMVSEKEQETKVNYVLKDVDLFYTDSVSGICKFIDVIRDKSKPDDKTKSDEKSKPANNIEQDRFIILNFYGIYNFEFNDSNDLFAVQKGINFNLNEKFEYPSSIRRELNNWYTKKDCMKRLRSCIYDKYFMVTQYRHDVQSLEVYNLAKMELETTAKRIENEDKFLKRYCYQTFSISKLQICFTRGTYQILLYYRENGLQVASKKLDGIKKIHSLEFFDSDEKILIIGKNREDNLNFVVWDLYRTGEIKTIASLDNKCECKIEDLDDRLASTSGNILYVNDKGDVISILKKFEDQLKDIESKPADKDANCIKNNNIHKIYCDKDILNEKCISKFDEIADRIEPWVDDDYEKNSYCLYYNEKETETEFLQLIVGRSTVQIWHQIYDDDKKNDKLSNKGGPFLEYIWTNGIPVAQERDETRLRVKFKYGSNDDMISNDRNENKDISNNGPNKDVSNNKKGGSGLNNGNNESNYKFNKISLEICWYIRKREKDEKIDEENKEICQYKEKNVTNETAKYVEKRTMVIKWKDIIGTLSPIRYACKALKHLNKRYINKCLVDDYNKVHKYEEIVINIKHMVWRFTKCDPEQFKLLDVRHNLMKSLILGDCVNLIKFILFGEEGDNKNVSKEKEEKEKEKKEKGRNEVGHIPRSTLWPGKGNYTKNDDLYFNRKKNSLKDREEIKPENDMELAIYHCKGRELKDSIMIAYLLEYYTRHATDCAGWMSTVSKAIPLLFKYDYDDYTRKLFRKECFADHNHFSAQDPDEIIPKEYQTVRNYDVKFKAFRPRFKLRSDKKDWHDMIIKPLENLKNMIYKLFEDFDNDLGKSPLALRVVPLPNFTIDNIPSKKVNYDFIKVISNFLWLIFVPRWYRIGRDERSKLSPFSRTVLYENNDDIYDNPAMEAVIDFRWQKAKNFFLFLFIRFLIFAICFGSVSWEYLNHNNANVNINLIVLIVIFYYLATYQFVTEALQLKYRGPKKYFGEIFNIVDMISVVLSTTIMTMMISKNFQFSDGFGSVKTVDTGLMAGISFSIFFLWIEFIFYLRLLLSSLGIYIYYFVIIFKTVFPFFLFMLIVILALGHTMFVLLRNTDNISTKDSAFSGNATNANETLSVNLKSDFDPKSRTDNPFSFFPAALMAAYFWIDGNWVQENDFDFWAVDIFTIIISVIIVIFLQNMLIAFMSGVYEKVETKSKQTLLRSRANHIADYEALHHIHYWQHEPDPKYIYYFGQSKNFEDWFNNRKNDQGDIYKDFEEKSTFIRFIFKEEDYDKKLILKYDKKDDNDDDIKAET